MTKDRKFSGEFIEFDEIRRKKSHCETIIEVNNKWVIEHPDECDPLKLERENEQASAEITRLEAILATEPPPPELPPRKPLFKVSGVLEEFSVQKVMGYFTEREYDPEAFSREEARNQVGALLLAITGNAAGSAVTGQSDVRVSDRCDFVRGKINGVPFYGWLGKTHVQVGDYVEMAVMGEDDHYLVYAIMFPELRTLSITPRCRCGREADIRFGLVYGMPVFASIFLIILIIFYFKGVDWKGIAVCAAMFGGILLLAFGRATWKVKKRPGPVFLLTENILTTLGVADSQYVDLRKLTKTRVKMLSSKPLTLADRDLPSRRSAWVNYFYYY